ncbi:ABC transporter ATP-binding protein/permease [Natroniella acetigena]|uniref:ABC transporter ATP-binding protein n=1 Tax=Natroniella acetigena TaxID=52004 RepID=UPI00200A69FD|nr:ABC transporter ATP-binding protein [Natroniella acetigena]MCK8826458.1 ABC transporter ATP-binding protein/permease [Natroniella acetigena]
MVGRFRRMLSDREDEFSLSKLSRQHFKFICSYLKPHLSKLIWATLAMLTVTITTLAGPYLTKVAVDDYILKGDLQGLNLILLIMLGTYGVFWFSSYWQRYLSNWVGQEVVSSIREDLYQHIHTLSLDFFHKQPTGDIISRLTNDVDALSEIITNGFIRFLNDLLTLVGIVIIMLRLNFNLALITFTSIPLILIIVNYLGKKMRVAYREVQEKLAQLNSDVEENISGIRVVQALNRERVNAGKFNRLSWKSLKANLKAVSVFALLFPAMTFSRVLGEALVLWYGGWNVINGGLTLGVLVAFLGYVRRFFFPLADLSQVYNTYQSAGAALDRIYEYLSIPSDINDSNEALIQSNNFKGGFSFEEVNFAYEDTPIIKNFNLQVTPGEVFALVGPTGAGKSTLVNLLTRLYGVDQGKVAIDGMNINQIPIKKLRQMISVVTQDVFLFNTSIIENIRYAVPTATDKEVKEVAKLINAHEFINKLPNGYQTQVGEEGVKLSGGQKQLISFARALLADPLILILDEATSSVDAYSELLIQQALETLLADRTALIIAHRFSTLKQANRIGVLQNGELIDVGTHNELLRDNSLYCKLFKKQSNEVI